MTPAEFKASREIMGYSISALAQWWGLKSESTISNWENGKEVMPLSRILEFKQLVVEFWDSVENIIESGISVWDVPRVDEPGLEHPAGWYRAIGAIVHETSGIRLNYK